MNGARAWALHALLGGAIACGAPAPAFERARAAATHDAPPPVAAREVFVAEQACASCHAAIVEEWRGSYHRRAFSDPTFQRSLALEAPEERSFCVGCHAPEAKSSGVEEGVGCASCHAEIHRGTRAENTCNACHQFSFEDGRQDLVQRTIEEHAASWFSTARCEDCHMPTRRAEGGHRDHRFLSAHSNEAMRRGVRIEAARVGELGVSVRLESYAGHAFPTGDMFRRARLLLFAERADGAVLDTHERAFGRRWGSVRGGVHDGRRLELEDTRLRGVFAERFDFETAEPVARIRYELRFERILAVRAEQPTLVSSEVIAEGLALEPSR